MLKFITNKFLAGVLFIGFVLSIINLVMAWRSGDLMESTCLDVPKGDKDHPCQEFNLKDHRGLLITITVLIAITLLFNFLVIQRLWFCK